MSKLRVFKHSTGSVLVAGGLLILLLLSACASSRVIDQSPLQMSQKIRDAAIASSCDNPMKVGITPPEGAVFSEDPASIAERQKLSLMAAGFEQIIRSVKQPCENIGVGKYQVADFRIRSDYKDGDVEKMPVYVMVIEKDQAGLSADCDTVSQDIYQSSLTAGGMGKIVKGTRNESCGPNE